MTSPSDWQKKLMNDADYQHGKKALETVDFLEQSKDLEELKVRTALIHVQDFTTVILNNRIYNYRGGEWSEINDVTEEYHLVYKKAIHTLKERVKERETNGN